MKTWSKWGLILGGIGLFPWLVLFIITLIKFIFLPSSLGEFEAFGIFYYPALGILFLIGGFIFGALFGEAHSLPKRKSWILGVLIGFLAFILSNFLNNFGNTWYRFENPFYSYFSISGLRAIIWLAICLILGTFAGWLLGRKNLE